MTGVPLASATFRPYDVAVSYASEDRRSAERLASAIKDAGLSVFYDRWEQDDLLGKDLRQHLSMIYGTARFCVVVISRHYAAKTWPQSELEAATRTVFKSRPDSILPVRLDGTTLPALQTVFPCYDLRDHDEVDAARVIVRHVRAAGAAPSAPLIPGAAARPVWRAVQIAADSNGFVSRHPVVQLWGYDGPATTHVLSDLGVTGNLGVEGSTVLAHVYLPGSPSLAALVVDASATPVWIAPEGEWIVEGQPIATVRQPIDRPAGVGEALFRWVSPRKQFDYQQHPSVERRTEYKAAHCSPEDDPIVWKRMFDGLAGRLKA